MYQKIILGTAQFGMDYGISNKIGKIKSKNISIILNFLKNKKINYLDTAHQYNLSEKEIGNFCKKTKKKFKIITKYTLSSNISVEKQLEQTHRKVGYYPETILAHSYKDYLNDKFQSDLKKIQKIYPIKNFGVSLYNPNELLKILKVRRPDIIQVPCNILDKRFLDKKIITIIKRNSIKVHARSIFLQGLLFKNLQFIDKKFNNTNRIFKTLENQAFKEELSIGELSLIWISRKKEIDKIILGVDSLLHLQNNLKIINKKISKQTYDIIEKIKLHNNKIIKPYLWKTK